MFLSLHIFFIILSFVSFNGRFLLAQIQSDWLQKKWLKITPHIIDSGLLLSGVALVYHGQWLQREHGWIISKLMVLVVYIVLGVMAMRSQGTKRWLCYFAALGCFAAIFAFAVTKTAFIV